MCNAICSCKRCIINEHNVWIENGVGIQIEEPFSILPMDVYCKALASNVLEMYDKCQGTKGSWHALLRLDPRNDELLSPSWVRACVCVLAGGRGTPC